MPEATARPHPVLDPRLDAALDSFPVVPLPPRFVEHTLLRIAAEAPAPAAVGAPARWAVTPDRLLAPQPAPPRPRFRLQFLDIALPAFFTGLTGLALTIGVSSLNRTHPLWAASLNLDARAAWQAAQLALPSAPSLVALASGLALTLAFGLWVALDPPWRAARPAR